MYPIFQEKSIENDLRFISEAFKSCSSSRSQSISLEKLDMCHVCFLKYDVPACGTRLGWRCRRRRAWLWGLWNIWYHTQSIPLEKLDIKSAIHVFDNFDELAVVLLLVVFVDWRGCPAPNRVQTYFSGYILYQEQALKISQVYLENRGRNRLRKFLPKIRWSATPPPPSTNSLSSFQCLFSLTLIGVSIAGIILYKEQDEVPPSPP